jgi:hypothetical protein
VFDAGCVAAWGGEVNVQIGGTWLCKKRFDCAPSSLSPSTKSQPTIMPAASKARTASVRPRN